MSKFEVGDKVRCYSVFPPYDGRVTAVDDKEWAGAIMLEAISGRWAGMPRLEWPQSCRRLKPRKRREWWIWNGQAYEIHNGRSMLEDVCAKDKWKEAVRVREARSGEGGGK